jgi:AcrR family transcriptional regulator
MGSRERQDRERHAVRESILTSARDLFVAEGYAQVSIRKIAERIEYSPAAIYSYFPSKDDIFFTLAAEGFQRLDQAIEAVAGAADPMDDLRNCWWAFYQFERVAARIQRLVDAGVFPATLDPQVALHVLWAALTGPAVLGCTCRLAPDEDPDALARDVLATTIAGLAAGTPLTFVPCHPPVPSTVTAVSPGVSTHEGS